MRFKKISKTSKHFIRQRCIVTLWSKYTNGLTLKIIGWKEQEPETELSIKHLKLSIAHFKACCNLFWYELKPALLISHTLVDPLI